MSEGISQNRMLLYIMIVCALPVFYAIYHFNVNDTRVGRLLTRLDMVQQSAILQEQKLAPNRAAQAAFRDAARDYLDKNVENINLLEPEVAMTEKFLTNATVAPDPRLTARWDALKKNTIQFAEGTVETYPYFKEVPETLTKPVEVDDRDIQKILSRIEGIPIDRYEPGPNRPQLIFTDFKLDHKITPKQGSVYSLSMKLIKREYL